MEKLLIVFIFFTSLIIGSLCYKENVIVKPDNSIEQWFLNRNQAKEKLTKIHFYIQDLLTGENATMWKVADSKITSASPSAFGTTYVSDILLTTGHDIGSPRIGQLQGLFGFADLQEMAMYMSVNIVFTDGNYGGSTISVMGRIPLSVKERELSIVGGTGVFRMARGIALSNVHTPLDEGMNYQVLEVTLYVVT